MKIKTSIQGYPRIGEQREWKRNLESFWKGEKTEAEFEQEMKDIRLERLKQLQKAGLDYIPVGDFSYYDHMLDTAVMFDIIPARFADSQPGSALDTYFSMARGTKGAGACEMTKWFNTNYHYIVPEIEEGWVPKVAHNKPLADYLEAKESLGIEGKPVLVGPYTFLKLSKGFPEAEFSRYLDILLSLYAKVISELTEAGASVIQIDEPALVQAETEAEFHLAKQAYENLANLVPDASLLLQTYFESVDHVKTLLQFPVKGIGLDLVHGKERNLQQLRQEQIPAGKVIALGVVDGRNVWKTDLEAQKHLLQQLEPGFAEAEEVWIQSSCSLLHSPVSLKQEVNLPAELKSGLAFAEEKLEELQLLKNNYANTVDSSWEDHQSSLKKFRETYQKLEKNEEVRMAMRPVPFSERQSVQEKKWRLPLLPTTTIGSFPQTQEMRQARTAFRKGSLSTLHYERMVKDKIADWVRIQEEIGLDVLVHGEFERNDMVEFFGEKLDGFAVTRNGWVQSYGSRCVKPPIIYTDVTFAEPMTVKETAYAQTLTKKPVKGMLTGPVTILNWSFERTDVPKQTTAFQIAQALQEEVKALEEAGIEMIQIDEPALREGLPLKQEDHCYYLDWAVNSFRASAEKVKDTTQIHTHMCYSEFHDIIDSISAMDADVISIETSRSHGELIEVFENNVYDKGIGLGVYDIHSPRIPEAEEMQEIITKSLGVLPAKLFWVNPDCGLKTRTEEETVAALKNMQAAAEQARNALKEKQL
ncbi:5-methyltetrahydropteroyltriglutamate--homocysteine S-methyltransferase [Alkalicoccus daliensis]|uniref:5-methyltetrahydropteroyltriglutamate--homocysteine methyltransferase n=1 Tax=Alkalicoccus daliensis TaxID=745820 RepID=A0A1H0EW87_9BACI|nr:5-methyltetrahydropteroyltriglutamate--homocysteine S-methyltransferase [Alkalicoccus daliensis]SDN86641.1 methionine synthase (B12-independent) [Alkalicoccus daliensis]